MIDSPVNGVAQSQPTLQNLESVLDGVSANAAKTAMIQAEFQMKMANINMEKGAISALSNAMRTTSQQLAQSG